MNIVSYVFITSDTPVLRDTFATVLTGTMNQIHGSKKYGFLVWVFEDADELEVARLQGLPDVLGSIKVFLG